MQCDVKHLSMNNMLYKYSCPWNLPRIYYPLYNIGGKRSNHLHLQQWCPTPFSIKPLCYFSSVSQLFPWLLPIPQMASPNFH